MKDVFGFDKNTPREKVVEGLRDYIVSDLQLKIKSEDISRPWGGFFKVEDSDIDKFIDLFYKDIKLPGWVKKLPLSPKILFIAPGKRLSWQYHTRRGEMWHILEGPVGVSLSDDNNEPESPRQVERGGLVEIKNEERHRLYGLETWGVIAELWVHIDPDNPSTEEEIVRLQDDYGRATT